MTDRDDAPACIKLHNKRHIQNQISINYTRECNRHNSSSSTPELLSKGVMMEVTMEVRDDTLLSSSKGVMTEVTMEVRDGTLLS